jgi:acyl dehydratase
MPVHHDRDYANSQGSPNIFMNIMTDNGLCSRFLTDWAGPEAMVRKIAIRLGAPAYAGSTLDYTGKVTGKSQVDGEGVVEVELRASNDQGDHVSGTAVISLPLAKVGS